MVQDIMCHLASADPTTMPLWHATTAPASLAAEGQPHAEALSASGPMDITKLSWDMYANAIIVA